ncbi:thrombospondin type 3 repeat protein [Cryptobacterium sp. CAG:338]|nr:thrombospondin type 3 repeat protein [Cryptobacterium sp. CAG:338]
MRSGTNNASQETSWSFRGKVRLAFVGALVVLMAGLCLATLSGCSILPAHALGGSVVKDSQVEQSAQTVGGNSSGLSQAYQGICQKCSDINNDGICDNCGSSYQDARQKCNDANNDGLCDNCGNACKGYTYCSSNYVDENNNGICDHREYISENHRVMNGTGANGSGINGTGVNRVGTNSSWNGQAGSADKGNSCQKGFARHCA